jgi:hypothetical protein
LAIRRQAPAPILDRALAIVGEQSPHGLHERRQRRLGVCRDREIDLRIPLQILIVALRVQIAGADADKLRPGLGDPRG